MAKKKILYVDDDLIAQQNLADILRSLGYESLMANKAVKAYEMTVTHNPDAILLDIGMPGIDGLEALQHLRELTTVPIIMLSAFGSEEDVAMALKLGADDFFVKPITMRDLGLRLNLIVRPVSFIEKKERLKNMTNLKIDVDRMEVTVRGNKIDLSASEFKLLVLLALYPGRVLPHDFLLSRVWGQEYTDELDHLRLYISSLRKKIEVDPSNPKAIQNEWGVGYRFDGLDHRMMIANEDKTVMQLTPKRDNPQSLRNSFEAATLLNQLISGVAHASENELNVIGIKVDALLKNDSNNAALETELQTIRASAEYCQLIMQNLKTLSGRQISQPIEVDLEALIRQVFFLLEKKLIDVSLEVAVSPQSTMILADEMRLKQIFFNLCQNAGEAMVEGGTLTINVQAENDQLEISISDTGHGIAEADLSHIFDLDFSTKPQQCGIGLPVTQLIVEDYGGTIDITNQEDAGTTVYLTFPITLGTA